MLVIPIITILHTATYILFAGLQLSVFFFFFRAFNIALILHLETRSGQPLQPEQVISVLKTLVERHCILRSTITQTVNEDGSSVLAQTFGPVNDFQIATVSPAGAGLRETLQEEIRKSYDFSSQLFRFCCFPRAPNKMTLCLSFHHIIADGSSIHTLTLELLSLLNGNTLPPNPPQFTDLLTSLQSAMSSADGTGCGDPRRERVMERWISLLGSAKKCTTFKQKYASEDLNENTSEWIALRGEPFLTHAIRAFSEHFNTSPTVIVTAMYTLALHCFMESKPKDIVIGCAFMNRSRGMQGLVGHTVSLLPLRVDFSESPNLSSVITQVQQAWYLILESRVTLLDLLSSLPCLNGAQQSPHYGNNSQGHTLPKSVDYSNASPLQTIISFHSMPQKHIPRNFLLPDGTDVKCQVDLPRSCDTHVDLFLEVRPPRSWCGEGSEVSYLFTWEYRVCSLCRKDITTLQNLMTKFLLTSLGLPSDRKNVVSSPGLDQLFQYASSTRDDQSAELMTSVADSYSTGPRSGAATQMRVREEYGHCSRIPSSLCVWFPLEMTPCEGAGATLPLPPSVIRPLTQYSVVEGVSLQGYAAPGSSLCFIERFMEKAATMTDQLAFKHSSGDLTYSQTVIMVNKLAVVLMERGVKSGDHVAILMHRSSMLYIALLAVLRCRAAYIPIALHNPQERILNVIKLSDTKLLVTETTILEQKLPGFKGQYLCTDTSDLISHVSATTEDPVVPPPMEYQGKSIAYIIFTSGTTGEPKGVAITNDSLSHTLSNFQLLVSPRDTAITLTGCTVAWDGHVLDSLGPLLNGACLVVVDNVLYIAEGVTHAFMSPSAASIVTFPRSMRSVMIGGEAVTQACYDNVRKVPKVVNVYGPTEATVFVTAEYITGPDSTKHLSSLGKPVPNVTITICDTEQRPLPVGTAGELCIEGPLVSRVGYYKNQEKTKSVFVPNPLDMSKTVYCTGDWSKMLPDGRIVFLGRKDDQVKLRGMRFQLLEVENTLGAHPQVKMIAAVVKNASTPSAQLVCYVTPEFVDVGSLYQYAHAHLPSYMVPSAIVPIDELPLKSEGKVDRRALINLPLAVPSDKDVTEDTNSNCQEPKVEDMTPVVSQMVQQLAAIFGRVLGMMAYSPDGNFFVHGGHSLLLFQLLQQVRSEMACRLELGDLLQNPTPLALAAVIDSSQQRQKGTRVTASNQGNSKKMNMTKDSNDLSNAAVLNQSTNHVSSSKPSPTPRPMEDGIVTVQQTTGKTKPQEPSSQTNHKNIDFDYLDPVPDIPMSPSLSQSLQLLMSSNPLQSSESTYFATDVKQQNITREFRSDERHTAQEVSDQLFTETNCYIPPATLAKYHNLDTLKTHLRLKTLLSFFSSAESPVVHLQPPSHPREYPLIFVHGGIIGWPLPYIKLAKSLSRYSIAIQRTESSPTTSFEAMAAYYVESIRSIQPQGPYSLIGVCYGAMLLYEIAKQLSDAGEKIQLAVFINHSPAIENLPHILSPNGHPLPGTFVHPLTFFRTILNLPLLVQEEGMEEVRKGSEMREELKEKEHKSKEEEEKDVGDVKTVVAAIVSSRTSSWIPFSAQDLESVYLGFYKRLQCAWFGYSPQPGANIKCCVLIRNKHHILFNSLDYGLRHLLSPTSCLTVITAPTKMGLLSDPKTMEFVRAAITFHLD